MDEKLKVANSSETGFGARVRDQFERCLLKGRMPGC